MPADCTESQLDASPGAGLDQASFKEIVDDLFQELFPICRSITGNGIRESFKILRKYLPLELHEIPSGEQVFDWIVPEEWNINDAYIMDLKGNRLVDFQENNLHVISYSMPVKERISFDKLKPKLHSLPDQPDAIPYLTSYYARDWGFCLSEKQLDEFDPSGEYDICIDSELKSGSLTIGECELPGTTKDEIFLSSYLCHPSMANNELSGPILIALLYRYLSKKTKRRFTYRFYVGPETIGALVYLKMRGNLLKERVLAGLVVTCCGDRGRFTFKRAKDEHAWINQIATHVVNWSQIDCEILDFFPTGSDERQYSSPGFNLPVASLMRSMYGQFPEYHTSLDDLSFVDSTELLETLRVYVNLVESLEADNKYINCKPHGEPHLGKYSLYPTIGGQKTPKFFLRNLRFLLCYSDGKTSLLEIAERAGVPIWDFAEPVAQALENELIEVVEYESNTSSMPVRKIKSK